MLDPISTPDHAKKAIIALLLKLKDVDATETPSELGYILHVALQLGLNEEDVYEIQGKRNDYPLKPPTEERDRVMILYYFLFFMNADGHIDEKEERLVKTFGFRLGFRPELTNDLISILKEHASQAVPPDKLLDKIKAYLN